MRLFAKAVFVVYCAAVSCAASTVYVGASYGLYKSTDSGTTWTPVNIPLTSPLLGTPIIPLSIALDPHDPAKIYFVGSARARAFFSSLDGGATWTVRPFVGMTGQKVGVDFGGQAIYVTATPSTSGGNNLLYRSTDGGASWTQLRIPLTPGTNATPYPNGSVVQYFAADKTTAGTVYVGNDLDEFFKSTDFGNTWTFIAKQITSGRTVVPQTLVRGIAQDPLNPKTWYMATDHANSQPGTCPLTNGGLCGMFKSMDDGATFTGLNIPTNYATSVAIGSPAGTVYAAGDVSGLGPSILKTTDGGSTWTALVNGLFTSQSGMLWADSTSSLLFSNSNASNHDFYVSRDGGTTFVASAVPQGPPGCIPGACQRQDVYDVAIVPTLTPVITSVVNAASLQPGIAANTWVTIFGSNLAGTTDNWNRFVVGGVLPTTVDNVKVTIGGKPAYVYYISPGQLNVLAPDIASGAADVSVTTEVGTSPLFPTTASDFSPAFFIWPGSQVVATRPDFSFAVRPGTFPGATTVSANPGDVLVLWATGFGATSPTYPTGSATPADKTYSTTTVPAVQINGASATVFGAALAPGSAGLYQIAIQVPSGLSNGNYPIQAAVGGISSPAGVVLTVGNPSLSK